MIRYVVAPIFCKANELLSSVGFHADGFRMVLFHDVPKEQETEFANFVEYAVKRYGVITPAEAEEWLTNGVPDRVRSARRLPLLFSFDDGFRSNFNIATSTVLSFSCL